MEFAVNNTDLVIVMSIFDHLPKSDAASTR